MKLTKEQRKVASTLIRVGRKMGASKKDIITALTVGLVEANLTNPNYGDGTSIGWRQEIDTYGSAKRRLNVAGGAKRFYRELRSAPQGSIGARAQAVQRSAYPDRYGQRVGDAKAILRQLNTGGLAQPVGGLKAPTGRASVAKLQGVKALDFVQSLNLDSSSTESRDPFELNVDPIIELRQQQLAAQKRTKKQQQPQKGAKSVGYVSKPKKAGVALKLANKGAKKFGLTITSTTGGNHVTGSYHYSNRAVDLAGSPKQMMKFFKWAQRFRPTELFYDPAGYYYKNGSKVSGAIGNHSDHVHIAM